MAQDNKYGNVSIPGIPDDEPIFILRGKDQAVPEAIEEYGGIAMDFGSTRGFYDSVSERADEIRDWQEKNPDKVKIPD